MTKDIKILLYTQAGVEFDISYIDEIPLSLNLLIADIKRPDKRSSTFSKTINLPGTKEINKFFELIWETNANLQLINPNLKCEIYYYINGVEQLRGDVQLLSITVNDETLESNYEVSVVGRLGNFFVALGDSLLSDLDFTEFDHDLTLANVTDSWATQIQVSGSPVPFALGNGYVYPLIDYGLNNGDVSNYKIKDLRPALYKKEVMDKVFALAGYTVTSNYLTSTYYKSQIIPAVQSDTFQVTNTYKNNSQFYAARTGIDQSGSAVLSYSTYWSVPTINTNVIFNDDTTAPYNDAGGNYNTGTGEVTIAYANTYNFTAILSVTLTFGNTPLTFDQAVVNGTLFNLFIQKFIGGVWTTIAVTTKNLTGTYTSGSLVNGIQTSFGTTCVLPNHACLVGDKFRVVAQIFGANIKFYNGTELTSAGQTASLVQDIKIGSTFYTNLSNPYVQEGLPISCNDILPINTKIIDWFMDEVYLGNLYIEEDKTNPKNLIIEDRDNFYTGEVDWTSKRDIGQKRIVKPMGELDFKRYDFTYKKDEDYYNKQYFEEYNEVYGTGFYDVTNDFIKSKQKKELMYSATPIVGNYTNGLVIPKLYKIDNLTVKPLKTNIRSLYYGGVIPLSYGNWTLKSTLSGDTVYTSYPFAGDCDNPYNPTLTLNWDTPKKIYYYYALATYTDNNLKNRYYYRLLQQVSDPNSKIEIRHYVLNEYDIETFSFRKVMFDTDAYFIVNAIRDYYVLKGDSQSTRVELLKLTDYDAYTPSGILTPPTSGEPTGDRVIGMSTVTGENNNNFGTSSRISGGSGNYIEGGATNVELTNCTNVVVDGDVIGFIGFGLSNVRITNANSNLFMVGNVAPASITKATKTASFTVDGTVSIYFIDTSLGDVTATFDLVNTTDKVISFIVTDDTNDFIITADSLPSQLSGNNLPITTGLINYEAIDVFNNGTNLYIK